MKKPNITGFTLHDRETGAEINAKQLAEEECTEALLIDDIKGFAFGADGQMYLLDECGNWDDLGRDQYDIRWKLNGMKGKVDFGKPFLFLTVDENLENAELITPGMEPETAERVLAFIVQAFAKKLIDSGKPFREVHWGIQAAVNCGLTEAFQEAYDEAKQ